MRRIYSVASETGSVSILEEPTGWIIFEGDDFNVPRIDAVFSSAPVSAGLITVKKKRFDDPTFEAIIYSVNPLGQTVVSIETLHGFVNGDYLVIEYANPDNLGIQATATTELPLIGDLSTSGITADNGLIRSLTSNYRRYYPIELGSIAPGVSGAVFQPRDANALAGWFLNSPTDMLYSQVEVNQDWDTSQSPVLSATYTVMTAGVDPADTVEFQFDIGYASCDNQSIRSFVMPASRQLGVVPQYTIICSDIPIPTTVASNPILLGDTIDLSLNLTATSDFAQVRINAASFSYPVTHVGIESTDV